MFSLRWDMADPDEIHNTIISGAKLQGTNMCILMLAILIASIGLNMNSTAVIIGAMLISPLMGGITAIGYGIATNDLTLSKGAAIRLGIQVVICLITSTIYFTISPITTASSELLARTTPTAWDVLIALFGGLAGIIGQTRKEKSNVIPGVAIATALMPPLCTAGYGLARHRLDYFGGALYLFFINSFFICLAAIVVLKFLRLPHGYYMAKQIIKLIWNISQELKKDKKLNEKLNVIFLEDYNVSLSEILMPAANISEQISLAGTEASGTGNMKLMINGAITLGTLDGANVEIHEQVGDDNIIIFGMNVDEVNACKSGYKPMDIYNSNAVVKQAIDTLQYGINGQQFNEIADSLKNSDPYMALKDFDSYQKAQAYASECYKDQTKWQKMSLANIAGAGIFSADRSVEDYARDIWGLSK